MVATHAEPEQEALSELTRLALEDRGYRVEQRSFSSLAEAHSALKETEADVLWAYGWDIWRQALQHDVTCGDAEILYQRVATEDAANGITWIGAAPCVRSGALAVRMDNEPLEHVHTISDLVAHVQRKDPALSFCQPEVRYEQAGGLDAMFRYYGLTLRSENIIKDSYEGCIDRVSNGAYDATYALNTEPTLPGNGLRLVQDDRRLFQRSYLSVAVSDVTLRQHPDLERTLKELAAALGCETLVNLQREAMEDKTSMAQAAQQLLEERRIIGSRRRRPTRAWE